MNKIFTAFRHLLSSLKARDAAGDPLAGMSPRELADLPAYHPPSH